MTNSFAIVRSVLTFFLFSLCISSASSWAAEPASTRVGVILALTGTWSEYGVAVENGLELARLESPETFRGCNFIFEDAAYGGATSVSAFNKLLNIDRADLIFVWGVEPALILAPLAENRGIPLLAAAQAAPAAKGRTWVIRTLNYSAQYSEAMLGYFRQNGMRNFGIVKTEMSFYNLLVDGQKQFLRPSETLSIEANVPTDFSDFRSIVGKLKNKKFDALGIYLTTPQIVEFYRQSKELGATFQTFGATPFQSQELVRRSGGLLSGAVYAHNLVSNDFRNRYFKQWQTDNQISWAANAYDMANLIGSEICSASAALSSQEIVGRLSQPKTRIGAGGEFHFVDTPETGKYFEYPLGVFKINGVKHEQVFP